MTAAEWNWRQINGVDVQDQSLCAAAGGKVFGGYHTFPWKLLAQNGLNQINDATVDLLAVTPEGETIAAAQGIVIHFQ